LPDNASEKSPRFETNAENECDIQIFFDTLSFQSKSDEFNKFQEKVCLKIALHSIGFG